LKIRHLALVGPTASGKSALALHVAERLGDVEIVSLDSMQVYRRLDIGTAKPTPAERDRVPHHLVDCAEPG
jgi:tRNA dimethylallyltransferase